MTLDLHREFKSGQMATSRNVAAKLVLEHHTKTYLELYQQLKPEQMQDVWNVVYFYERLWLLINHGHIRKDYVKELFADTFYYWLTISFQSQLVPIETHSARNIAARFEIGWIGILRMKNADDGARRRQRGITWMKSGKRRLHRGAAARLDGMRSLAMSRRLAQHPSEAARTHPADRIRPL
jgi:hypothetical protein